MYDPHSGINTKKLNQVAKELVTNGKGILAIDESPGSIEKKFIKHELENTEENRRKYRECLITTPELSKTISGVILHGETFFQKRQSDGKKFVEILKESGIHPGIKLDLGLEHISYENCESRAEKIGDKTSKYIKFQTTHNFLETHIEKVPKGLDTLDERLKTGEFKDATFAKWRCVFSITEFTPTFEALHKNCDILAKYAAICQKYEIVPILEPEILFNGSFSIEEHFRIFKIVLSTLVTKLNKENVYMPGVIFKTGFVTSGDAAQDFDKQEVAVLTHDVFTSVLPLDVAGVVFLSGGHSYQNSVDFLEAICQMPKHLDLSFSYGRGLTDGAMTEWKTSNFDTEKTQTVFKKACEEVSSASVQKLK
ncbi:Fructose-biphosphate aldolase [Pseudoloma neurophilia]|uniref:fructose-bisphosphate aldolase n=1 Tax=Pseudoloma neurophilia TaxID=146866 RepID=A0A0R0M5A5_9MICR|nr:Fructose-biphosphate aldolase [Pseudoloma neurophilia]